MTINVAIAVCLLVVSVCAQTPTPIPYLGTPAISTPPVTTNSIGQVITKVSDVQTFKFWLLGFGNGNADVTLARWTGSAAGTAISTKSFALPFGCSGYIPVTVSFNVEELDPTANYVIYITLPATSGASQISVATNFTSGSVGGLVKARNGVWNKGYPEDVFFELTSLSLLKLVQVNSFTGRAQSSWGCEYVSTYTSVQVNWYSLLVNTGYFGRATSTLSWGTDNCNASIKIVPYGTAARCDGTVNLAPGKIDLRNTSYAVDDTFNPAGHISAGSATKSSNNQVVDLRGGGSCGWEATTAANTAGEEAAIVFGGLYLKLIKIN